MTEHQPKRSGRWRSGEESRQRILDAARAQFRDHGYSGTTVRAVAGAAGVDSAMVFYFFGNKRGLFDAAIDLPPQVGPAIDALFLGGVEDLGVRIVRTLLESLEKSDDAPFVALTRSASTHDESQVLLRQYVDREFTGRITATLGTPDAPLRAGMVGVQVLGLAMARYVVRLEPLASASVDELAAWFGPLVQHCLTGPTAAPAAT
ncbi:TetR family transcriptional regulator [Promicromonospora sp. NPDC060271]|uniref:TetR/AcrR family transcriptional regulator n=1 Tax=Promicromonospora sp. NPDC060271 TaxID=3347089 RepID=UPI0036573007